MLMLHLALVSEVSVKMLWFINEAGHCETDNTILFTTMQTCVTISRFSFESSKLAKVGTR